MGWFRRKIDASENGVEVERPEMEPIEAESWSRPENGHRTLCITQADWSIRWHLFNRCGVAQPEYERRGSTEVDGELFDVYEAAIPGGRREYWINVSYWFGRGLLMEPTRLNAPPSASVGSVREFLGEHELRNLPFTRDFMEQITEPLGSIGMLFAGYSSRQFYNNVATVQAAEDGVCIMATAVRRFLGDSLPLFHGFGFVKPFLMHQVMHLLSGEDTGQTEVSPQATTFCHCPAGTASRSHSRRRRPRRTIFGTTCFRRTVPARSRAKQNGRFWRRRR